MPQELKRRNISGIFIYDLFPNDDHRRPTCIEDCQPARRREWMESRNQEYLRNVIKELADSFKELSGYCHKEGAIKDEYNKEFIEMADRWIERSKWNWARHELADQIDMICGKIVMLADAVGVVREHPEETANDDDP